MDENRKFMMLDGEKSTIYDGGWIKTDNLRCWMYENRQFMMRDG